MKNQLALPLQDARERGNAAAQACLAKAEGVAAFDTQGAAKFIHGWVLRHGPTSGEDLVDAAVSHGYRCHDLRAFGGIFKGLCAQHKLRVVRSDLPRKRGNGTSGGRLYGAVV